MDVNVNYEIRIKCIDFQKFVDTNSQDPEYIKKHNGNTYNLLGSEWLVFMKKAMQIQEPDIELKLKVRYKVGFK